MKNFILALCPLLVLPAFFSCTSMPHPKTGDFTQEFSADEKFEFDEIWGYVFYKRENAYNQELPVTDIGYFTEAITSFSEVPAVPPKEKYFSGTQAKVHLVTSCDSRSQTHLLLSPELPLRDKIIAGLLDASETYDGLQIDWELVSPEDEKNFLEFLSLIKAGLKDKPLSVAVPARIKTLEKDAYNYSKISQVADRVIIMAYDEHWSTSKPGPVASNDWCKKISDYAKTQIPPEKLVMGMSFYGRAWRDDTLGGKAYIYPTIQEILAKNSVKKHSRDKDGIPSFTITKKMTVTTFYDDALSLSVRTKMYAENGINAISFWRLGQEDSEYWKYLKIRANSGL
ncbi:glycosyl hydrolase family 18 protein [uncultured Treponema sp.]|uniref:glycosyl hydrolase family 18 protein n=1 Tax=uncultured Treponema sp. TaxID=162155 RepID=UPI0015BF927D|nr:glycosyl hydrolase family 18 protein [uncultured Treponema sp.]